MSKRNNQAIPCKMILVGDLQVGKTALFNKLTSGNFNPNEPSTISAKNTERFFNIDNKSICVDVWDTAGQEKYKSINQIFFNGADVVIILFDITNKESFTNIINEWIPLIKSKLGDNIILGIAGNKYDLFEQQQVNEAELQQYATSINADFSFISCLQNLGIEDFIIQVLKKFISVNKRDSSSISINEETKPKKKCC